MKKLLRVTVGFGVAAPFYALLKLTSLFIGRPKATAFWGPVVSFTVKRMAEITLIPKISDPEDYDRFIQKMKRNLSYLGLLYDVTVEYEDDETFVLNYHNCPHCEAFHALGVPELGAYACDSDWDIACANADVWDFARQYQIGTGDSFCNHTYRKKSHGL